MNGLIDIIYSKRDTNEWTDKYNRKRDTSELTGISG